MVRRPRTSPDVARPDVVGRDDAAAVFARAAELDVEWSAANGVDDGLDTDELIEIGTSAGLSPTAIRQAVAELRGGALVPADRPGVVALRSDDETWVGPRGVVVQRAVDVSPRRARGAAERFLREQLFELERDQGGRSTWRRRDTFAAGAQRMVTGMFRRLDLDGVVAPVVLAVVEEPGSDGKRSIVRFEADLAPTRSWMAWAVGGTAAATGLIGGGIAAAAATEIVAFLAAVPVGGAAAGSGVVVGRHSYRRYHDRASTCLEAFLDRLEHHRA